MSLLSKANESTFDFLQNGNIHVGDAVVIWKNFEGRENQFGSNKRTFSLVLPEGIANQLQNEGWNIKFRPGRDEDDDPLYTTEIVVNMGSKYPPEIYRFSEYNGVRTRNKVEEEDLKNLDNITFETCDLVIHPFEHNRGLYKVKGYLNRMQVIQANDYMDGDDKFMNWMNGNTAPIDDGISF